VADIHPVGNQRHGDSPVTSILGTLPSVVVLGGGLAGMTAALRLAEAGHQVTLVERRPYLGGRAYSFLDSETRAQVDNGQHIFLGCCTAYTQLLSDVGTLDRTFQQSRLRIEVRAPDGVRGVLSGLPLPAPLHLLLSFLRYPHINWREKLRAALALLRIHRERYRDRPELRAMSFADWLRENGQSPRAIANLWDLIVLPSLNDSSESVSASIAFMLFQVALLQNAHGADVGYAKSGLSDVMGEPMAARLRELGAALMLGRTVDHFTIGNDGHAAGIALADGEAVTADYYVSALPPEAMLALLPERWRDNSALAQAATHTWSPIVNLHIWYDRPVADFDFVAFIDSPVQWVFNRTRIAELEGPGDYLTVSLSGAMEHWNKTKDELRELFLPELERLLPQAKGSNVERFVVVKEQRATFRSLPASPENRLAARTPVANLVLAGDWTDTGWPATMESAVRSGNIAASIIQEYVS
jgi:squalene-associated FAD-dependent desaturase